MKSYLFVLALVSLFSQKSFSVEVESPYRQQAGNSGVYEMLARIYGTQTVQKEPTPSIEMTNFSSWSSSWNDQPIYPNQSYDWDSLHKTQRTEIAPYVPSSWDDQPVTDDPLPDFRPSSEQEYRDLIPLSEDDVEKKLQVQSDPPTLSDILKELDVLKDRTNTILLENLRLQDLLKANLEHSAVNQEEANFFYNCIISSINSVTEQSQQIIQHVKKTDYNPFRQGLKYIKTGAAIGTATFTAFETYATTSWFVSILPLAIAPPGWIPLGLSVTVGGLTYVITIATF